MASADASILKYVQQLKTNQQLKFHSFLLSLTMSEFLLKSAISFIFFIVSLRLSLKDMKDSVSSMCFSCRLKHCTILSPVLSVFIFTCHYLPVNTRSVTMLDALYTLTGSARWLASFHSGFILCCWQEITWLRIFSGFIKLTILWQLKKLRISLLLIISHWLQLHQMRP